MNKKVVAAIGVLLLIIAGAYFFIRYHFLKGKDFKPDTSKQKSIIDLRPSIIAKLQQLVKDGSDGLYILSIKKIDADVLASKLDVIKARIRIDTSVMLLLDSLKKLPDDIFTIDFDSLHIDGIGIGDLLDKKQIDIAAINISNPVIEVYHQPRAYNKAERMHNDTLSLYKKIKGRMNKISIGDINISKGSFVRYKKAPAANAKFNDISIRIHDLLIDSSTQFDTKRFMFAKHAAIEAKDYTIRTPDSLYFLNTGRISILAEQHKLTLSNIELKPRGNRKQFESKLKYRKEMYHLILPKTTLYDVDWWTMMNTEKFIANKAELTGGQFSIFLDRTLPKNPTINIANFPHQMLMKIPVPVSLYNLELKNMSVSYEEYNPDAKKGSIAYFDNISGQLKHVSNISGEIKKHPIANFSGHGLFMHLVPMQVRFTFDLSKFKTGEFTSDVDMDTLNNYTVNPLAEPLALFSVRSGQMQHGTVYIAGNNFTAKCKVAFTYTDLHINPLKKADDEGRLKKKRLTGFFANILLIKNNNPVKGKDLRQPEFSTVRDHHGNFFNMIWITTLTGILKTIGIPVKLVIP